MGLDSQVQMPVTSVLDTGAGPNLVHLNGLPSVWQSKLVKTAQTTVTDASRNHMRTLGVIRLFMRIGNLVVWDHFVISTNLTTSCLLRTTFIDKHFTAIYPQRKQVAFHHSRAVALLSASHHLQAFNIHESFPTTDKSTSNKI